MVLLLVDRLSADLLEDTKGGTSEEEAVAEGLDEAEAAELEVAIVSAFHQGVGLLSFSLSDLMASSSSRRPGSSPKAARICDMFGCSDIFTSGLEAESCQEIRVSM